MDFNALFAGIASGYAQIFIGYPFDSIKTWTQNIEISKRPKLNLKNLYKGVQFPLIQSPFTIASGFFINENVYKKYGNIYFSSMCSGIFISLFLCPFDYYKINYQQHKVPTIKHSFDRIHIVALREIPANICYFSTYHYMRNKELRPGTSGAISGICSWLLTYPIDTIKSRLQIQNKLTFMSAISQGNFYKGINITCLRAGIVNFIGFEVYEYTRMHLTSKKDVLSN